MREPCAERRCRIERSYRQSGNVLVRELTGPLREVARACVEDREAAEDIVNEVFSELFEKQPKPEDLEAFLRAMVRRRAIDWLRRERQRRLAERRSAELSIAKTSPATEVRFSVWQAVARLPARARAFMARLYLLGASESEAALGAGYAPSSAKKVRSRSLSALRQALGEGRQPTVPN